MEFSVNGINTQVPDAIRRPENISAISSAKFPVKDIQSPDFIGTFKTNTASNKFLKEYLEGKALNKGIKIPDGMKISVSSPEYYSQVFQNLLKHVSKDIYQARVIDLFRLITQDKSIVEQRVAKMQISEKDKQSILKLKEGFDGYYKLELSYGDRKFDLLNLSDEDKKFISGISKEFGKFLEEEQAELKKHTTDFAQKEVSKLRLDDAGHNSAVAAGGLATILTFLVGKGVWESRTDAKRIKLDRAGFIREQAEIFKEGVPKLKNPFREFIDAAKNGLTKSKAKNPKALVLSALLATTIAGSADDLMGCVKDSIQDVDNFGWEKGMGINIPAALFGILTSAAIAPMIEGQVAYNRAGKYLKKFSGELGELGINPESLKNNGGRFSKFLKKGGKTALLATGIMFAGKVLTNTLKGIVTASSSSGSSWGSMAGTRIVMEKGGNDLEKKGIITHEENTFKNTSDNMMAYEAYKGKWTGISQQDPIIGATGGALGLFTHSNPYVQSLSFGLQGCSETLTACYYQVTGAKDRTDSLAKEKQALLKSIQS